MEVDVIQKIRDFKPDEFYALTYSIDLQYVESFLLPLLNNLGCTKTVIIADSNKISEAIETDRQYLSKIGKEYFLIPIHAEFSFHPKIYLFKRRLKATTQLLCLLGSGNLTYTGLNINSEIFAEIEWDGEKKLLSIWDEIVKYFQYIFSLCRGESTRIIDKWIIEGYPQKMKDEKEGDKLVIYPNHENIFTQYKSFIKSSRIRDLFITAPFYDNNLSAIKEIVRKLKPQRVQILLQPGKTKIDKGQLIRFIKNKPKIQLRSFVAEKYPKRYLHAKLVIAITEKTEHILVGSANISDVALFGGRRVFNYEACLYKQTGFNHSVINHLKVVRDSHEISINEIPTQKRELDIIPIKGKVSRIVSAEYFNSVFHFHVRGEQDRNRLNIQFMCIDGKTIIKEAKRNKAGGIFVCEDQELLKYLFVRIYAEGKRISTWVPILFVNEIGKRTKRYYSRVEKYRSSFIGAQGEQQGEYYLQIIIDNLIDEELHLLSLANRKQDKKIEDEDIQEKVSISIKDKLPKIRNNDSLGSNCFMESLDYVISALRERRMSGYIEGEEINLEEKEDFPEYDNEIQQKKEKEIENVENKSNMSQILRKRRRLFINNMSIHNLLARLSYFSLISLPHMPNLHKYYIGDDKNKYPCIDDYDWEEYLTDATEILGNIIFKSNNKAIWPDLRIESMKKEIVEIGLSTFLYSIATKINLLMDRSVAFSDEGYKYCLILNRMLTVAAALFVNYCKIDGANEKTIKEMIAELYEYFPCAWEHIENSLKSVFNYVRKWSSHDFENTIMKEFGSLNWIYGRGFILTAKGVSESLWPAEKDIVDDY